MNRWGIPREVETFVRARDTGCVYCRRPFGTRRDPKRTWASWEHIINDTSIHTPENIALCCMGCNASKGVKDLVPWLQSDYCKRWNINRKTVAFVAFVAICVAERKKAA